MRVARPLSRQRGRMTKPPKRTRGLRGACLVRSSANIGIMFLSLTTPCPTLHGFASSNPLQFHGSQSKFHAQFHQQGAFPSAHMLVKGHDLFNRLKHPLLLTPNCECL